MPLLGLQVSVQMTQYKEYYQQSLLSTLICNTVLHMQFLHQFEIKETHLQIEGVSDMFYLL